MSANPKIALFFLGDVNYDARCFNMLQSLSKASCGIDVFHLPENFAVKKAVLKNICFHNLHIKHERGWRRFYDWMIKIKHTPTQHYQTIIAADLYSLLGLKNHKKNIKIIYDVRDFFDEIPALKNKPLKKYIWKFLEKKQIKHVHTMLCTSNEDKKILQQKFIRFRGLFFETIYNFPVSKHIKKTNYLREKYSISDKQNILIYQGIIEGGRGIKSLLGCVQRDSSLCAVIVGAGPDKEYYKKLIYQFKINNRCFFHDQVEYKNLLAITSSADLGCALIQPNSINNNYALPNKIFEYANCGLPVLASNLPIMSTYIKKYKLGICINSKNKEGLNKAISFLLKNKKQYMKNQHLKALSWQAQDQKFLEICT